jgi:hypothetical protein
MNPRARGRKRCRRHEIPWNVESIWWWHPPLVHTDARILSHALADDVPPGRVRAVSVSANDPVAIDLALVIAPADKRCV